MPSVIPRTIVASGDFRVAPARRESLVACLGSCVGLAIVDRTARAGGLLHILLPDDEAAGMAFGPAVCARTGVPLFLEQLAEIGCAPERMEATVAGGSLVGTVSALDLDLDIGGRTVDVVNTLLKEAGVQVTSSETGGHFGSRLVLNLETLASSIEPLIDDAGREAAWPERLTPEALDAAIMRLRPIPQVALKVMRMLQGDDYGLLQIAREVGRDQVLTAKVIKACNAAYLGAPEEIRSIDQALLLLGGRMVGALILSSAMASFYATLPRGYSMTRGGLYHHAVSTAIVAEQLALVTKKAPRDLAYTAGLLHDVGKVLLDQYVAPARPLFYREVFIEGGDLREVERSVLGISHDEAGARLADLWAFPAVLRDPIAHHSDPSKASDDRTLTYLVYLADLLVLRFNAGHDLDRVDGGALSGALEHLGLTAAGLRSFLGRVDWKHLLAPGNL